MANDEQAAAPKEAVISSVRVAAAHEGDAELVVTMGYANGATSEVVLDHAATNALMQACDAKGVEDLTGVGWQHVRDALVVSYNRFQTK